MKPADFATVAWRHLKDDLRARLADLREQNDRASLTAEQTAVIRGRIAEVKRILDLDGSSSTEGEGADE